MDAINALISSSPQINQNIGKESQAEGGETIAPTKQDVMYQALLGAETSPSKAPVDLNELARKGLRMLQAAFEGQLKNQDIRSPEQHIAEAQKYGSFQAYLEAEWTPEKVSARITGFALPYFDQWMSKQHDLSYEAGVEQFGEMIGKSIKQGYDQAMQVLGEVPEEVKAELEKTLQLSQDQIAAWKSHMLTPPATDTAAVTSEATLPSYTA